VLVAGIFNRWLQRSDPTTGRSIQNIPDRLKQIRSYEQLVRVEWNKAISLGAEMRTENGMKKSLDTRCGVGVRCVEYLQVRQFERP
jgi:hypothetical protein